MGGTGNFSKPPAGPKLGPTQNYNELSEEKKRELGDLAGAAKESVFKPAKLHPAVAQAEQQQEAPPTEKITYDWNVAVPDPRAAEAAESLDALQSVLANDSDKYRDEVEMEAAPTEEDKQNLFRAILGNRRYEKTFSLFGGMLRVTMTELTPYEEERVFAAMGRAQVQGAVKTEDDWSVMFERLRMMYSIREIHHTGQDTYSRDPETADVIDFTEADTFPQRFSSSVVWQSLSHVTRVFRRQLDMMVELALSPDFWKVDGPDSQQSPSPAAPSTTAVRPQPDRGSSASESSSTDSNGS